MLKLLGVSSSGYYSNIKKSKSQQAEKKEAVKEKIIEIHNESRQIYGAPKIRKLLLAEGYNTSIKTVSNYMREEGIKAVWVRPYVRTTIDSSFDRKLKNILDRQFNPSHANAVWVTDITYIYTTKGFVYLTSVMDLFSRKIIGWQVSDTLSAGNVVKAIEKAKKSRRITRPIIIHSDRGRQYISQEYLEATPAKDFIHSYSNTANPWDNACIESFHAIIKREWLNRFIIKDLSQAHDLVFEYIEAFYNTERIHSHCEMMSPNNYEKKYAI